MGYKTADGTIYYPPPSDHLRSPIPQNWQMVDAPKGGGWLTNERLSEAMNWIPVLNEVKGIDEAINGKEWFTSRQLSTAERALNVIPYAGRAKNITKTITKETEKTVEKKIIQNAENTILKSEKAAESTENAIVKKTNKQAGDAREAIEKENLEKMYPDASVQGQRYLRDENGKIVKDPVTGKGRKVDFGVIKDDKAIDMVETTSQTANKRAQTAKEERIRNAGGTFIRDKKTKKLIDVKNVPTRISRHD